MCTPLDLLVGLELFVRVRIGTNYSVPQKSYGIYQSDHGGDVIADLRVGRFINQPICTLVDI